MSDISLKAYELSCVRDDRLLFSGLNFLLNQGQVLLLEGRNGSGKTSLLRILCGIRAPETGGVEWCGRSIEDLGGAYHADLTYVGHLDGIKKELTVRENLRMAVALGKPADVDEEGSLKRLNLYGYEEIPAQALSAGQKRRLALARLLVTRSRLWILDEPFTSLDKQGIAVFESLVTEHTARDGIVILTSHHDLNLDVVEVQTINLSA